MMTETKVFLDSGFSGPIGVSAVHLTTLATDAAHTVSSSTVRRRVDPIYGGRPTQTTAWRHLQDGIYRQNACTLFSFKFKFKEYYFLGYGAL